MKWIVYNRFGQMLSFESKRQMKTFMDKYYNDFDKREGGECYTEEYGFRMAARYIYCHAEKRFRISKNYRIV